MRQGQRAGLIGATLALAATLGLAGPALASADVDAVSSGQALAWSADLGPWGNATIGAYTCPAATPYLLNHRFHGKLERTVPKGVRVDEPGGVGVTIGLGYAIAGPEGYVNGWVSNVVYTRASNWLLESRSVRIYANCTDDKAQSYTLREIND